MHAVSLGFGKYMSNIYTKAEEHGSLGLLCIFPHWNPVIPSKVRYDWTLTLSNASPQKVYVDP